MGFLFRLCISLCFGFIVGCTSNQTGDAAANHFIPAGWLAPEVVLRTDSFADYTKAVRQLLVAHRIPFDESQAEQEINAVAPVEYLPAPHCPPGQSRGIVILVHGLSDTALAMRDLAEYFGTRCFIARTIMLPGHGTRLGDMLVVDQNDWLETVRAASEQAAREHNKVLLAGFSLGAVLTLSIALEADSQVTAVMAFSPAYTLSSYKLARLAPWLGWVKPWIDRDLRILEHRAAGARAPPSASLH